jgi:4-hydroxy-3-polyprenylbenzoate decarboxylase
VNEFKQRVTLAITGASGVQYAIRLLQCLIAADVQVFVMVSRAAQVVTATETDLKLPGGSADQERFLIDFTQAKPDQIKVFSREQWMAPVASGSGAPSTMVVCPCSTGSLSAIATGASNNLMNGRRMWLLKSVDS